MNFPVPGQAALLEPLPLRNVRGGTATDEDVFEIHLSTFFAITQDKLTGKDYIAFIFSTLKMFPSTVLELHCLEFHEHFVNSLAELKKRKSRLSCRSNTVVGIAFIFHLQCLQSLHFTAAITSLCSLGSNCSQTLNL